MPPSQPNYSSTPNLGKAVLEHELVRGEDEYRFTLVAPSGARYRLGRTIKEAIYGKVVHAVTEGTGGEVAIKIYCKDKLREYASRSCESPLTELAVLQTLAHPGIIKGLEFCADEAHLFLVMEYMAGGDLYDAVESTGRLDSDDAKSVFRQIVAATAYLHASGVAHRDISLENVLLDRSSSGRRCVLIDLGMCAPCGVTVADGAHGKKNYIAPEMYSRAQVSLQHGDVWSLGVLLFILLTGAPPFDTASNTCGAYRMIVGGRLEDLLNHWNMTLDSAAVDLISRILQEKPQMRLGTAEILAHPWLTEVASA